MKNSLHPLFASLFFLVSSLFASEVLERERSAGASTPQIPYTQNQSYNTMVKVGSEGLDTTGNNICPKPVSQAADTNRSKNRETSSINENGNRNGGNNSGASGY